MTMDELLQALALPPDARIDQRVPKKLLAEQGVATAADRRLVQDGVEDITWFAALKPHLVGVPAYRDDQRSYLEIAVLGLQLRTGVKPGRLAELLHRAVPYPVLLLTGSDEGSSVSLAHLRASRNEADKTVLDGSPFLVTVPTGDQAAGFAAAMALARQSQGDLYALYQGWIDTVQALDIARESGVFQPSATPAQARLRHAALLRCRELQHRIAALTAQALKERQLARQVALNQSLCELKAALAQARYELQAGQSA